MAKNRKIIGIIAAIVALVAVVIAIILIVNYRNSTATPKLIGGDRDEHGCLTPGGYSWCAVKAKCLRVWEEPCQ